MNKKLLIVFLLATVFATSFAGVIITRDPAAASLNGRIEVSWQTGDESGVVRFEVMRARVMEGTGGAVGEFAAIASINANGRGSDYKYEDKVFNKSDQLFYYKVRIYLQNGQYVDSKVTENPVRWNSGTTSTVRRTWGSIKAMFR